MRIAELNAEGMEKLQALEEKLGTVVVALEPVAPVADLSEEQTRLIQEAEEELQVVLLAVEPN